MELKDNKTINLPYTFTVNGKEVPLNGAENMGPSIIKSIDIIPTNNQEFVKKYRCYKQTMDKLDEQWELKMREEFAQLIDKYYEPVPSAESNICTNLIDNTMREWSYSHYERKYPF
jgi:hypothetical protein